MISDQAKVELKKRQTQQKEQTQLLQGVFESPNGKLVLKEISKMCNEHEPTYVDHNPNGTAYKEGQRSIIIGIRKIMNKTFNQEIQTKANVKGEK